MNSTSRVELENGKLAISFPYDPELVAWVKGLEGRKWVSKTKTWTALLSVENIDMLRQKGFSVGQDVNAWYDRFTADQVELDIPGLKGELFPFQKRGVQFLEEHNGRALIADEMGLGKTVQTLAWLQLHKELYPVVIIVPASVKLNWEREVKNWMDDATRTTVLSGRRTAGLCGSFIRSFIINYDILDDWVGWLKELKPKAIVLDECHYIKSGKAKRTKAVRKLCRGVPHIIALSGTPIINRPMEMYTTLSLLQRDLFPNFWQFARRYCLPSDAPVLMADLTEKPISLIKVGDKVIGWSVQNKQRQLVETEVTNTMNRRGRLQKVILEDDASLISSPRHRWLTGSKTDENHREYSIAKTGRLGGRGRNCASRIAKIMDAPKAKYITEQDYMLGYIAGVFRGDGYCTRHERVIFDLFKDQRKPKASIYNIGLAMKDVEPLDRAEDFLRSFSIYCTRSKRKDGLFFLNVNRKEVFDFFTSNQSKDTDAWYAGFLGGFYDAEGSGNYFSQHPEKNSINCALLRKALQRFNLSFSEKESTKTGCAAFRMLGGRKTLLRFWSIASPVLIRKLKSAIFNCGGKFITGNLGTGSGIPFVKEIIPIQGIHQVYNITTNTGNYVAYGCGSKNCNLKHTRFGWDYTGSSNTQELHDRLTKTVMIRRLKKDVLPELPEKTRTIIPIELNNREEYDRAEQDFVGWLKGFDDEKAQRAARAEALARIEGLKQLTITGKLGLCKNWIENFLDSGEKLVVFCTHQRALRSLYNRFADLYNKFAEPMNTTVVFGGQSAKNRQIAIDQFQHDKHFRLIICNIKAGGVGINLQAASNVAFVELGWTPGEMDQAEDRVHRIGQTASSVNAWYLLAADTIEEEIAELLDKKRKVLSQVLDGKDVDEQSLLTELLDKYKKEK